MQSILLLAKTCFILLILGGGALLFSADANRLVLIPIDRMVQRVKSMAENPRAKPGDPSDSLPLEAADTEMRILEASIDKISELLGVAFGDAGVDIISANMRNMGGLNPMVPGHRTVRTCLQLCGSRFRTHAQLLPCCSLQPDDNFIMLTHVRCLPLGEV